MTSDRVQECVAEWRNGRPQPFNDLLTEYLPRVKGAVRAELGQPLRSKLDSDDILQEALATLIEVIPRYSIENEEHLVRLLKRLAQNAILSRYHYFSAERRSYRRERKILGPDGSDLQQLVSNLPTPSEEVTTRDHAKYVLLQILLMSPERQDVLVMRFDGMSYDEMAKLLGISRAAAQKRYTRALRRLVDTLRKQANKSTRSPGPPADA